MSTNTSPERTTVSNVRQLMQSASRTVSFDARSAGAFLLSLASTSMVVGQERELMAPDLSHPQQRTVQVQQMAPQQQLYSQQQFQQLPAQAPTAQNQQRMVQTPVMTGMMMPVGQQPMVQQVQLTLDPRRPLDQRIDAMPKASEKLEVIQSRSQLVVTASKIRRIAWSDTQILDVVQFSEKEISLIGQGIGTTDLWIWFEDQENPLMYVVTVIRDPSLDEQRNLNYGRIERKLQLLYPNSKVYLIPISRKIIVRGQARDAEESANIMNIVRGEVFNQEGGNWGNDINGLGGGWGGGYGGGGGWGGGYGGAGNGMWGNGWGNMMNEWLVVDELRIPGEFQIKINVKTAEINRSAARSYGVNWSAIINNGAVVMGSTMAAASGNLTGIVDSGNFSIALDVLQSNGVAKILDDARVITLSGEAASFLSGGEFAVPTIVGVNGAQGQQTSFRGYGTSIICTPTVLDNDLIRLEIVPELSQIDSGNAVGGVPGLNVRRVQTRVELREGQSIVLGGLFSRRERSENVRVPFLGEIPIAGTFLFNSKRASEDETEMLIVVTPEIVRAMDADQVPPMPGWYSTHPNDYDFYKYNRTEGNPDLGHHQLMPFGNGNGYGQDVGYNFFNPAQNGGIAPQPTGGAMGPSPGGVYPGDQQMNYQRSMSDPGMDYGMPTSQNSANQRGHQVRQVSGSMPQHQMPRNTRR